MQMCRFSAVGRFIAAAKTPMFEVPAKLRAIVFEEAELRNQEGPRRKGQS